MAKSERVTRPLVEMKGIVKTFGGIHALEGVNPNIYLGEVHVILGENGAGKSTRAKSSVLQVWSDPAAQSS
jgi:ABC-type sugar transport system ATPase subunit